LRSLGNDTQKIQGFSNRHEYLRAVGSNSAECLFCKGTIYLHLQDVGVAGAVTGKKKKIGMNPQITLIAL
jgi:hypothetical protein